MATEDGDITIGPAKMLGLFFMLVAICGVFFAIGYSLGKTSAREQAMNDKTRLSASLSGPMVGDSNAAKPSAVVPAKNQTGAAASQDQPAKQEEPDLTFFNAVKRSDRGKQEATETATATSPKQGPNKNDEHPPSKAGEPVKSAAAAQPNPTESATTTAKTDNKAVVTTTANGAFVVQIAAVTREEDAAALAGALRRKNYSVFVVNNPAAHDKFYHVQVGPFGTLQDAEAMKVKLTGEGYNPIVKRS